MFSNACYNYNESSSSSHNFPVHYTEILSDYKIHTNINNIYSYAIHVNVCMYACMLNLTVIYFFSLYTTMTFYS